MQISSVLTLENLAHAVMKSLALVASEAGLMGEYLHDLAQFVSQEISVTTPQVLTCEISAQDASEDLAQVASESLALVASEAVSHNICPAMPTIQCHSSIYFHTNVNQLNSWMSKASAPSISTLHEFLTHIAHQDARISLPKNQASTTCSTPELHTTCVEIVTSRMEVIHSRTSGISGIWNVELLQEIFVWISWHAKESGMEQPECGAKLVIVDDGCWIVEENICGMPVCLANARGSGPHPAP